MYGENLSPALPGLAAAGNRWATRYGKTPAYLMPSAIGAAWLLLLVIALRHLPVKG
jgi:hypothetical protein